MPKPGSQRTKNNQEAGGSSSGSRRRGSTPSPAKPEPERRRNTISTDEAHQYWAAYASVPEDAVLPDGWELNRNRVPVPPPPRGHARLQEIHRQREHLQPELRADPLYAVNSPEWDRFFEHERQIRLNSFFAPSPPSSWFDSDDESMGPDDLDAPSPPSSWFDSDDESMHSDDFALTDADLYVRQPGEVGWVEAPNTTNGGCADTDASTANSIPATVETEPPTLVETKGDVLPH